MDRLAAAVDMAAAEPGMGPEETGRVRGTTNTPNGGQT